MKGRGPRAPRAPGAKGRGARAPRAGGAKGRGPRAPRDGGAKAARAPRSRTKRVTRAEPLAAAARPEQYPRPGAPEVAFLGRSNVGKSSLLNRLVQRRKLALTSATPGKTRLLYWYRVERGGAELWLVDLPGYGWARVSKSERRTWRPLVEAYLEGRPTLRVAVLLQDLRRDLGEDEALLLEWLAGRGVPTLLVATKVDKLKPMRRAARLRELALRSGLPAQRVIATSAEKGIGIAELWRALDEG